MDQRDDNLAGTSADAVCIVLDEACRAPEPAQPCTPSATMLRAVRAITSRWHDDAVPQEASLKVNGTRATVAPLRGPAGRRIALFIES